MAKIAFEGEQLEVEVRGVIYTFKPLTGLADATPGNLIIIYMDKRRQILTHFWECTAEADYELQGHMEAILVSDRHKWFNKSFAMSRLTSFDERSFSFTGPDKKSVHMVRMGNKYYASKLN